MPNDRISDIRKRCEAATKGPWKREQSIGGKYAIATPDFGIRDYCFMTVGLEREADAAFIAHSREDLPWALDQITERDKEIERFHDLLAERNVLLDKQDAELDRLTEALRKAGEMNPYKQIGNHDSYSQYNEGWQDAVSYIEAALPAAIEKGE